MTARDGREAVRLARERRADVCLMDIRMPVLDGVEATPAARRFHAGAVVGVSGILVRRPEANAVGRDHPWRRVQLLQASLGRQRGWEVDAGPVVPEGNLRTYILSNIRPAEILGGTFGSPAGLESRLERQRKTAKVRMELTAPDEIDNLSAPPCVSTLR